MNSFLLDIISFFCQIDQSVLDALPEDMRQEILMELKSRKEAEKVQISHRECLPFPNTTRQWF